MRLLYFFIAATFFTACTSVLDSEINPKTIQNDLIELKAELVGREYDEFIGLIELYSATCDDRESLINHFRIRDSIEQSETVGDVVDQNSFNDLSNELFKHFAENKATYRQILTESDAFDQVILQDSINKSQLHKEIDKYCVEQQIKADSNFNTQTKKNRLNEIADSKVEEEGFLIIDGKLTMNWDYKTPETLWGSCPYLSRYHPLKIKEKDLDSDLDKKLDEAAPLIRGAGVYYRRIMGYLEN